ncbi:SDR family oxidoreductase [Brevibacillus choshinensis]|uniref:SDR family oxidoreductase n=1 Tax=Brevibacillus choshinensis TaxID=54911 RepID=UPI002E203129|nr:SDR family oxidoreductase [Brevibacillus choshinensis]MED4581934.1 SDR family oxidoreductase [Brevibacillus choshinensis]MED4780590.1 SDR family oxidoreductase [Brevibacillus choshinensis]
MYPRYPYYGFKTTCEEQPISFPAQHQDRQPGMEYLMVPRPIYDNPDYLGSGKLKDKVAIITGGDSGIGRAVAVAFAKEGADVAIAYLDEHIDAEETRQVVEGYGSRCLLMPGDLRDEAWCREVVQRTVASFGKIDVLVMNQGVQFPQTSIQSISRQQLEDTFRTNIYPHFFLTQEALPYLKPGSSIISTTSVTAYAGHSLLVDYSATKGAIVSFTRSLSLQLVSTGVRVNAVAPGPVWTPLQVSSYTAEYITTLGADTPMRRAGQPFELAPTYVYLASDDSGYVTGQVLHVNGGTMTET